MNRGKKELSPLHCLYYIYYCFATKTDENFNQSQINQIVVFLNKWTGNNKTSEAIINETKEWIKENKPSKEEELNIMFSMIDYLKKENIFSLIDKEHILLQIRQIARYDGSFSESEKKYHDLLAFHFGLNIRVSACTTNEIKEDAKKIDRRKIGFKINRN